MGKRTTCEVVKKVCHDLREMSDVVKEVTGLITGIIKEKAALST